MGLGQRRVGAAVGVLALAVALTLPPHAPADGAQDHLCPTDWASACPSLPCSPLPPESASSSRSSNSYVSACTTLSASTGTSDASFKKRN